MESFEYVRNICKAAKNASSALAGSSTEKRNAALEAISKRLIADFEIIERANAKDIENAKQNGIKASMIDRLTLGKDRIFAICDAIKKLIALPDVLGSGERFVRPNGLVISECRVPLGVCAIIYEARPNVTVDAATLCLKTGNCTVLRGGKEAIETNRALVMLMKKAVSDVGFSPDVIGFIDDTSHASSDALMQMCGYIDVLIPRGGRGLISAVKQNAKVPVIETGAGNCHLYVDKSADTDMAIKVAVNAKMQRPSVCNAIETVLCHRDKAEEFLTGFYAATRDKNLEFRGCERTRKILADCKEATDIDYDTEYNDYIVSVKVVDSLSEAIGHIAKYSTGHSESIITNDIENAERFCREVDSAAVYVNASTRFTDGEEFGFGAEIGISTQKLHARGPMAQKELTTIKYIILGNGQVRA
ncbi:MAG: glutamate-5-semialdehyde dehydrogenase [Clostridia bacterium]|nr:glutamate-5-semialdehyde dehydrogenase [Clostridia bacterium]